MTAQIVDGRAKFGCSLLDFYRQDDIAIRVARRGIFIPPIDAVAEDAPPALAFVDPLPDDSVRWIAVCPDCRAGGRTVAQYVWLETPLLFCARCANAAIGSQWRRVGLPAERLTIERMLLARPDPQVRVWRPGETTDDLAAENVMLAGGGG